MPIESAETPGYYKDRKFLLELELVIDELEEHKMHKIDLAKLKGFGIDHQRKILNREDSAQPSFFAPYPSIPGPSDSTVDDVRSISNLRTPVLRTLSIRHVKLQVSGRPMFPTGRMIHGPRKSENPTTSLGGLLYFSVVFQRPIRRLAYY
ncbi:hypothetical protein PENCOP_c012G02124 [Penicillium coprophilum]|uniref:Uncharacterized protein n=1 Tax=Penicillium coprophilum TaxID=36646 RepID=A0A1V6UD13_9EURO|nr:hypothetical protein PENCOP_c012G02124 [Penicillium coprophilum]